MRVLFILLMLSSALALGAYYEVELYENGNAKIVIDLRGNDSASVFIPADTIPGVDGKHTRYETSVLAEGNTHIVYISSELTKKDGDWLFELPLGNAEYSVVDLKLPYNAFVTNAFPNASIEDNEVSWVTSRSALNMTYSFKKQEQAYDFSFIGILLLLAMLIGVYFSRFKPDNSNNVLRTLSNNQRAVVELLIQHGDMRRNLVERKSGLSKASLAKALDQLEKKNILKVDKTDKTHFVSLTDWFKEV